MGKKFTRTVNPILPLRPSLRLVLLTVATEKVAGKFPGVKFAIIDSSAAGMKSKPTNVEGLLFSEQEAGYLVGYLSGLYAKDNSATSIGSTGGLKIPPVDNYIAG